MAKAYTIDIKVRGYHLDVFGHVNNARYLEFMEEARWAVFEQTVDIIALAQKGYAFTVVNINIDYRRPALLNDPLRIETTMKAIKQRSGIIHHKITLNGTDTIIADADVTFVMVDSHLKKAAVLQGEILTLLEGVFREAGAACK